MGDKIQDYPEAYKKELTELLDTTILNCNITKTLEPFVLSNAFWHIDELLREEGEGLSGSDFHKIVEKDIGRIVKKSYACALFFSSEEIKQRFNHILRICRYEQNRLTIMEPDDLAQLVLAALHRYLVTNPKIHEDIQHRGEEDAVKFLNDIAKKTIGRIIRCQKIDAIRRQYKMPAFESYNENYTDSDDPLRYANDKFANLDDPKEVSDEEQEEQEEQTLHPNEEQEEGKPFDAAELESGADEFEDESEHEKVVASASTSFQMNHFPFFRFVFSTKEANQSNYARLIYLHYMLGHTYKEIADRVNSTEGAVKKKFSSTIKPFLEQMYLFFKEARLFPCVVERFGRGALALEFAKVRGDEINKNTKDKLTQAFADAWKNVSEGSISSIEIPSSSVASFKKWSCQMDKPLELDADAYPILDRAWRWAGNLVFPNPTDPRHPDDESNPKPPQPPNADHRNPPMDAKVSKKSLLFDGEHVVEKKAKKGKMKNTQEQENEEKNQKDRRTLARIANQVEFALLFDLDEDEDISEEEDPAVQRILAKLQEPPAWASELVDSLCEEETSNLPATQAASSLTTALEMQEKKRSYLDAMKEKTFDVAERLMQGIPFVFQPRMTAKASSVKDDEYTIALKEDFSLAGGKRTVEALLSQDGNVLLLEHRLSHTEPPLSEDLLPFEVTLRFLKDGQVVFEKQVSISLRKGREDFALQEIEDLPSDFPDLRELTVEWIF